jgi:predicted glycosyltransferase
MRRDLKMAMIFRRLRPDLAVSTGVPYSVQAARLCGTPSIAFSDTEIATLVIQAVIPFVSAICTPSCFDTDLGPKQVRYNGYHELAYLHPNRFTPDPSILSTYGIGESEPFILVRISSADSSHDMGEKGSYLDNCNLVSESICHLEQFGRIILTSELPLPDKLSKYQSNVPPHKILDLLSFATLYVGEGATMASEAGVLGIPWIYVSNSRRGYLRDQEENYGLGRTVPDWKSAGSVGAEWMNQPDRESSWREKREKLLRDKIDVTEFITRFIEGWPQSFHELAGVS